MMTANSDNTSFAAMSRDVVQRFLQSVVVLDDLASLEDREPMEETTTIIKLPDYGSGSSIDTASDPALGSSSAGTSENVDSEDTDSIQGPYKERGLFARPLIDAFAKLGLVCAVLRSEQADLEKDSIRWLQRRKGCQKGGYSGPRLEAWGFIWRRYYRDNSADH